MRLLPDRDALARWAAQTGVHLPLPPGPPEGWSTVLDELGAPRVLARTYAGLDACDRLLLRALHQTLGRPVRGDECEALLLVAPVPAGGVEPALCELLVHPSYWVRQHAAWLVSLGSRPDVDQWLVPLLSDPDNDVRRAAAAGLARHPTAHALSALLTSPWDADEAVDGARIEAVAGHWAVVRAALSEVPEGPARPVLEAALEAWRGAPEALAALLASGSEPFRHAAGVCLAAIPEAAAAVAERVAEVLRSSPGVDSQRGAVAALAAAGDTGVELAIELLGSESWAVRQCAARVLSELGHAAAEAEPMLVAALDDADADVQREAAFALLAAGRQHDLARRRLLRQVSRSGRLLARARARGISLGPLDPLAGSAPPGPELLSVVLAPGDERVRGVAALLLADALGPTGGPLLEALAADEARRVPLAVRRAAAAGQLRTLHVPVSAPIRVRLLLHAADDDAPAPPLAGLSGAEPDLAMLAVHDGDGPVRQAAWAALQTLGPVAEPYRALAAWHAKHDPDAGVRRQAAAWVDAPWRTHGPAGDLQRVLAPQHDGDQADRPRALRSLWRAAPGLGQQAGAALTLHDDHRLLGRTVARLWGRHASEADLPALVARALGELDDARWTVREAAADLLGALPVERMASELRAEVIEALQARALADYDNDVQQAARTAVAALAHGEEP